MWLSMALVHDYVVSSYFLVEPDFACSSFVGRVQYCFVLTSRRDTMIFIQCAQGYLHNVIIVMRDYLASKSVVADTSWSFLGSLVDGTAFASWKIKDRHQITRLCVYKREREMTVRGVCGGREEYIHVQVGSHGIFMHALMVRH